MKLNISRPKYHYFITLKALMIAHKIKSLMLRNDHSSLGTRNEWLQISFFIWKGTFFRSVAPASQ